MLFYELKGYPLIIPIKRVIQNNVTRHISTDTYTVSCEYDAASRLSRLTYSDNMQILYSYDDLNRTTEIKRYVDGVTGEILLDNIQYTTESLLTSLIV